MPYLRVTCPDMDPTRRRNIAEELTIAVVELFTPPRGPSAADIRARTTVHFTSYGADELFVAGCAAIDQRPDVTIELSDWSMSTRQQARVAAVLTPRLVQLFDTEPDAVNLRFHSYPPTDFAVGGVLSAPASRALPASPNDSWDDPGSRLARCRSTALRPQSFDRRSTSPRRIAASTVAESGCSDSTQPMISRE